MAIQQKKIFKSEFEAYCRETRGTIIHYMVNLEDAMDILITNYFIGFESIRSEEFLYKVLEHQNASLSFKKDLIFHIIESNYPEILIENKKFKDRLENLITDRNIFAHRKFIILESELDELVTTGLSLKKYDFKKGERITKNRYINDQESIKLINEIVFFIEKFNKINEEITKEKLNTSKE